MAAVPQREPTPWVVCDDDGHVFDLFRTRRAAERDAERRNGDAERDWLVDAVQEWAERAELEQLRAAAKAAGILGRAS